MPDFAVYLHPETLAAAKPLSQIPYQGHSFPYFAQVREALADALGSMASLALRQADFSEFKRVHAKDYLEALQLMALDKTPTVQPRLSLECTGFEYFLAGYCYALGGMMQAVDHMKRGVLQRVYCFSLGGHHAYSDWGHGYCILNTQAAAARYAQAQGFKKVLIIDWDIHHGDGTQSIFAHDPDIYCISIHSIADLYMTLQRVNRQATTTAGQAVGHCNIPLLYQKFDETFFERIQMEGTYYRAPQSLSAFQSAVEHVPFQPDIIFIFSGYDSHSDDCGAGITDWTNDDYRRLTRMVMEKAKPADIPIISVHGGGYKLPVTVAAAVAHVEVLAAG